MKYKLNKKARKLVLLKNLITFAQEISLLIILSWLFQNLQHPGEKQN